MSTLQATPASGSRSVSFETATIRKIKWRLVPFLFICYLIASLDRINVGFAALTMNKELGISAQEYGFVAGMFFISYFAFEVPSNVIMHKVGARVWIARILITWGLIAAATGFVQGTTHLYIVRFLLGAAEAGFFPGIILYFTYFFRQKERAQVIALMMMGLPACNVLGAPISGFLLDYVQWFGLSGWRWMLIIEGIPAVILGIVTYYVLPNRPAEAKFLSQAEKDWLQAELKREEAVAVSQGGHISAMKALGNGRVWYLAITYFCFIFTVNWINFFLPQVVKSLSSVFTNTVVGLLVMIPAVCSLIAMVVVSRSSDRTGERRYHAAAVVVIAGVCAMASTQFAGSPVIAMVLLTIAVALTMAFFGPFWSLPSVFLTGAGAASGIALINCFAQLAGFVGPTIVGYVNGVTGSLAGGAILAGIALLITAGMVLALPVKRAAQ